MELSHCVALVLQAGGGSSKHCSTNASCALQMGWKSNYTHTIPFS